MTVLDLPKIKRLRKQLKLTQPEMAERLNLKSGKLYHDRESGKVLFSADELARVAVIFGVAIASLYSENFFNKKVTQSVTE